MIVKMMNGRDFAIYECQHIEKTVLTGTDVQAAAGYSGKGVLVTLSPSGLVLRLPDDGEACYVMNDHGDTVDVIRWPEREAT